MLLCAVLMVVVLLSSPRFATTDYQCMSLIWFILEVSFSKGNGCATLLLMRQGHLKHSCWRWEASEWQVQV